MTADGPALNTAEYTRARTLRVTWAGLILNLLLTAAKLVVGALAGSAALVADGVHSFSDMATDLAIIVGVKHWTSPPDRTHPHGHGKLEVIVTVSIGLVLAAVALGILWNAVSGVHQKHESAPGLAALVVALVSIAVKEFLYRWTVRVADSIRSEPLRANAWHHRSDALSSIPVAIAVAAAAINPSLAFVDHIGAVVVSMFILKAAWDIVSPSFGKLMDTAADPQTIARIREIALSVEGIDGVEKVRTRYLGCDSLSVEIHIEVPGNMTVAHGHDLADRVRDLLVASDLSIADVVVHVDPVG